jgi:hypothetical protein
MKKNTKISMLAACIILPLLFAFLIIPDAFAQSSLWQSQEGLGRSAGQNPVGDVFGGGAPEDPRVIVANLIRIALGFIGIILVVLLIIAGFRWMTSAGNQDAVSKSKSQIVSAIIGLIIIVASYALAEFITSCVYGITDSTWMCSR